MGLFLDFIDARLKKGLITKVRRVMGQRQQA
jgi:hypothetical protein